MEWHPSAIPCGGPFGDRFASLCLSFPSLNGGAVALVLQAFVGVGGVKAANCGKGLSAGTGPLAALSGGLCPPQVHLQTQQEVKLRMTGMALQVVRSDGVLALYNGLSASLCRQVPGPPPSWAGPGPRAYALSSPSRREGWPACPTPGPHRCGHQRVLSNFILFKVAWEEGITGPRGLVALPQGPPWLTAGQRPPLPLGETEAWGPKGVCTFAQPLIGQVALGGLLHVPMAHK